MATALRPCSLVPARLPTTPFEKPILHLPFNSIPTSIFRPIRQCTARSRVFTTVSSTVSTEPINPVEPEIEGHGEEEKFNWLLQWYPVMPVCDLDKRIPHAKKVIGLDVVVWWDRNEKAWKVFDDMCPHRLAPLSEGRIDQWGRLQCVYPWLVFQWLRRLQIHSSGTTGWSSGNYSPKIVPFGYKLFSLSSFPWLLSMTLFNFPLS